ncbi:iron complex transport system substrate-binding protein [Bacillus pakistanensis]|uniref:Iron complex transport system substrate-binding protein n=1 Tax=Rossellomorea pakistanensis TaxID=992288 RepID=A0ABS2N7K1_9BACI|nr:iron complex transport system substrate-binding protein [Bacillus pakistanensis]
MKKFYSFLLVLLLSFGVLAGCGQSDSNDGAKKKENPQTVETEKAEFPVTIKDASDKEVVIEKKPERIVSLIPSNTEIAFSLGLGDEVVGVSDFDTYPKEVANKEKIGGMDFNLEKIISLNPDLVLAHGSSAHNSTEGLQQLRDSGIKVIIVNDAKSFEEVYNSIEMVGKATGEVKKSKEIISDMKGKIANIKEKAAEITEDEMKTVYVEVSPAPEMFTTGKNTFMNEMLEIINANNMAGNLDGWVKIDQEAIIKKNPDVIITTYGYYTEDPAGQVLSRDGWKDINAVKNKQVFDVHSEIVTRSGPRLAEGVEELANAIYPEVFK